MISSRPLLGLAIAFIFGISLEQQFQLPFLPLLGLSIFLLAIYFIARKQRTLLLLGYSLSTGMLWHSANILPLSPLDIRRQLAPEPHLAVVRGTLLQTPVTRVLDRDEQIYFLSTTTLRLSQILLTNQWEPVAGEILVTTSGETEPTLFSGALVEISGVIKPPPRSFAPGLFDYRKHLAHRGIFFELRADSTNDWKILVPASAPLSDRFTQWARKALSHGLQEDQAVRLTWAMALGWKPALNQQISEPFMKTGTLHIFAISGLHITLIAAILVMLLRVLRFSRAASCLVVLPLIWFYTGATGWQPSAIRSTIMASILILGWSLKRPADLLNSLAAAALICLSWDSRQLFHPGFQLSFLVVLGLALLLPAAKPGAPENSAFPETASQRIIAAVLRLDPFLPTELRPGWQRWLEPPATLILSTFFLSLASWLASLLITIFYFNLFSLSAVICNLLIVPLSSIALASNLAALFTFPFAPPLTELFNHASWAIMSGMISISESAASLRWSYRYMQAPSVTVVILGYLFLFGTATALYHRNRLSKYVAVFSAASLLIHGAVAFLAPKPVTLTLLPLAGGCIYIEEQDAKPLLIDAGNGRDTQTLLIPFLRSRGLNSLPQLLLTHGDARNVRGYFNLLDEFEPEITMTSNARFRSPIYRQIMQRLSQFPGHHRQLSINDQIGRWEVLHPAETDQFPRADDKAIVLFRQHSSGNLLLLSGLGEEGQRQLLRRYPDLRADCIITGLPDQGQPLLASLIESCDPELIIITSPSVAYHQPVRPELRERLAKTGKQILYTSDSGSITLRLLQGFIGIEKADASE